MQEARDTDSSSSPAGKRLLIVLAGTSIDAAQLALRYAATASAMDLDVELHAVSAGAVGWLAKDRAPPQLLARIRQAVQHGVELFVCPAAAAEDGLAADQLIPEVEGVRGAASLLEAAMQPTTKVITF
jgi:predicted peroxiredoxin